ncbi:hypothetical protein [uncultured Cocleimonas sp.]|uniref:hypothetical protein n=1 Tax=uncultured Cocleimonas sp. TaxID=1051587 RepID=UPI0026156E11|nr:hypothetical protein [uncultured Cocleimonas sp.]
MIGSIPHLVFANASNTSKIGISVVIKESTKCDLHVSNNQKVALYTQSSSNCLIQTDTIRKQLSNISYQQKIESGNNEFARIVMVIQ